MTWKQFRRSGLTLTELLVVVTIVVTVTAVLAPLLTPTLRGREVREAARNINMFIQNAQARAKELGRGVGVMIERAPNNPNLGYQLSLAEEVPPFKGWTPFTKAIVVNSAENSTLADAQLVEVTGVGKPVASLLTPGDAQPNDWIRFNFRGEKYRIRKVDSQTGTVQFVVDGVDSTRHTISPNHPVSFEIFRRPRKSVSTPLELPVGTSIVMSLSGVGLTGPTEESRIRPQMGLTEFQAVEQEVLSGAGFASADMPLTIMFDAKGSVDRVYRVLPPTGASWPAFWNFPPKRPHAKLFLFVGKDGVDPLLNLADASNLWVTIDPISGAVTSAPNAFPVGTAFGAAMQDSTVLRQAIASSRQLAATGQSIGGR